MTDGGLLRGTGLDLGPHALRFPLEDRTLLNVLEAQARERPDHEWLVFDGTDRLTFAQARARVHQVGHAVAERLSGGGHVGLFLRNQVEFVPAFLGAMCCKAVTVPLNADSRGPLLEYVITKAEVRILIARVDLLDRLAELDALGQVELIVACGDGDVPGAIHGAPVVRWDAWLDGRPESAPADLPKAWEVALIQFTSGTTGNSKGVVYPHHFLYLYSAMVTDSQERTPEDVLSTPLPLFHVAALHIVAMSALHAGCTAHLKSRFSATSFWDEAAADGATFAILIGAMAEIILKTVPEAPPHRVGHIFCVPFPGSGEQFQRRYGVELLWQGYGMTEVYTHPMPRRMEPGVPYDTIGRPVSWMEYGVVDEHDLLLAPGEIGELVFRPTLPHAMAHGYYKAPEATAEVYRGLMFHTGDLAFYDEEGRVHYKGRRGDRIRRRGENVSATELEFVAMGHECVVEAAAYGVPGEFGEHDVKLDVVLQGALELEELHAWLESRLPRFMVPRYLERVGEFPKTPSMKIEKYRLAERSLARPEVLTFDAKRR